MNTIDNWQTTATVTDADRARMWNAVFGSPRVPVKSIVPTRANLPGRPDVLIYQLDVNVITSEQRAKLCQELGARFGLSPEFVDQELDEHGVPILADDVSITSTDRRMVEF